VLITSIDPWLGLGALIGLIIAIVIDVDGSWKTFGMWERVQKGRGKVAAIAHESFDGALTVKSLGREPYVSERFAVASDDLRDRVIDVNSTWTKYQVIMRALPQMLIIVLMVVGALRITAGAVTAGDLVTVAYLLSLLAFPIQLIGFVLWDLAGSLAGWRRVQEVLDADDHVLWGEAVAAPDASAAPVTGRTVGFSYDGEAVLSDLDLELKAGTTLAVVGPTASGKSTRDTACVSLPRKSGPRTPAFARYSQIACVTARRCASLKAEANAEPRCPLVPNATRSAAFSGFGFLSA
jgi:ABC-type multidrug transport system fused ATPase/permease subunit